MRRPLLILLLIVIYPPLIYSQSNLSANWWLEDLDFMISELEVRHANLFHTISKEEFEKEVKELESKIPALNREEIIVELERLLAKIGDGHTGIFLPFGRGLEFKRLPVKIMRAKDGFFIQAATDKYSDLIGKKLVKIGNQEIFEIIDAIKPIVPRDNEFGAARHLSKYLVIPELLHVLGFLDNSQTFEITVENADGLSRTAVLKSITQEEFSDLQVISSKGVLPLWLQNRDGKFWMEYLKTSKILYVQLNSSDIGGMERDFANFADKIVETVNTEDVVKLVLDLRRNAGGSIWRSYPILSALIRADKVNKRGSLFIIISPTTFSAGASLAALIDLHTNALFVGEPTGGKPNAYGDIGRFNLPHSRIQIRYSRLYMGHSHAWDTRPAIFPDLRAEHTIVDYRSNSDPALEVIKNYKPRVSLVDTLLKRIGKDGFDEAVSLYKQLKENNFNRYLFGNALNRVGYRLLKDGHNEKAVKIFELNVEEYPWSPNTYDSLADGYFAIGKKVKAMDNLNKAFHLNKYYTKWRDLLNNDENN